MKSGWGVRGWPAGRGPGGEVPGMDAGTMAGLLALPAAAACPRRCRSLSRHSWSLGAEVAPYLWLCFPELNSRKCDNQN